jgi:hypothetical protein
MRGKRDRIRAAMSARKDKRPLGRGKFSAVPAGGLVLPILQIQQPLSNHGIKVPAKSRIYVLKNRRSSILKLRDIVERGQRWPAQWIYIEVPGAKIRDVQKFSASFANTSGCRDYNLLDCVMETLTVLGGIVKALELFPSV